MTKKTRRLILVIGIFGIAASAMALTLGALDQSITYFYLPSDLAALETKPSRPIRLGGLVAPASIEYAQGNAEEQVSASVKFVVTDGPHSVQVVYAGILPDLFREGQGVIAEGRLDADGETLSADNVLAKHDENYMPKEIADALKEKGLWNDEGHSE